jgi:hypothetical protein
MSGEDDGAREPYQSPPDPDEGAQAPRSVRQHRQNRTYMRTPPTTALSTFFGPVPPEVDDLKIEAHPQPLRDRGVVEDLDHVPVVEIELKGRIRQTRQALLHEKSARGWRGPG